LGKKYQLTIAIFSILLFGNQISAFAEPGNTEVIWNAFNNGFSELTINDPDGIANIVRENFDVTSHGCSTNVSPFGVLVPRKISISDCQDPRDITEWMVFADSVVCVSGSCLPPMVGGTLIPIDTTALLIAGAQVNLVWILPLVLGAGIVACSLRKKN